MKKLFSAFVFFAFSINLILAQASQEYVFRVMVSSGKNEIKKLESWQPLRTGNKLSLTDQIQIETGSFLGLAHKSGKTIELKTPGVYKISDIASKINSATASAAQKYADFVVAQMTKDGGKTINQRKGTTGSTERAIPGAIKALLPYSVTCNVFEEKTNVVWYTHTGTKEYSVNLMNLFDESVLKKVTKDTTLVIDFADEVFKKENDYKILIKSNDVTGKSSGDGYSFHKLNANEKEEIEKEIKVIKQTDTEESSLQKIVLASFYEDKKLYLEALKKYKEAIAMEPEVSEYKLMYQEFLERYGMTKVKK